MTSRGGSPQNGQAAISPPNGASRAAQPKSASRHQLIDNLIGAFVGFLLVLLLVWGLLTVAW